MPLVCRLGDTSTHGGSVITAAQKYRFEGARCARVGDTFFCPEHGIQTIVGGSSKYKCEGQAIARHGDPISCGASLISGASKYSFD